MTYRELIEKYSDADYEYVGIRFENMKRNIGDVIGGCSKVLHHDREFPVFGSEDYESLDDADGISAWSLVENYEPIDIDEIDSDISSGDISAKYAYIIVSDSNLADESCDENEAVYDRPTVIEIIEL